MKLSEVLHRANLDKGPNLHRLIASLSVVQEVGGPLNIPVAFRMDKPIVSVSTCPFLYNNEWIHVVITKAERWDVLGNRWKIEGTVVNKEGSLFAVFGFNEVLPYKYLAFVAHFDTEKREGAICIGVVRCPEAYEFYHLLEKE